MKDIIHFFLKEEEKKKLKYCLVFLFMIVAD